MLKFFKINIIYTQTFFPKCFPNVVPRRSTFWGVPQISVFLTKPPENAKTAKIPENDENRQFGGGVETPLSHQRLINSFLRTPPPLSAPGYQPARVGWENEKECFSIIFGGVKNGRFLVFWGGVQEYLFCR